MVQWLRFCPSKRGCGFDPCQRTKVPRAKGVPPKEIGNFLYSPMVETLRFQSRGPGLTLVGKQRSYVLQGKVKKQKPCSVIKKLCSPKRAILSQ